MTADAARARKKRGIAAKQFDTFVLIVVVISCSNHRRRLQAAVAAECRPACRAAAAALTTYVAHLARCALRFLAHYPLPFHRAQPRIATRLSRTIAKHLENQIRFFFTLRLQGGVLVTRTIITRTVRHSDGRVDVRARTNLKCVFYCVVVAVLLCMNDDHLHHDHHDDHE